MRKQILAGAMVLALATGVTTSAIAFERGAAAGFHEGFHRGGLHGHGAHHGWNGRRFVGGHGGRGYGPRYDGGYYEGVAPFGRMVGPATGGSTFFVGM